MWLLQNTWRAHTHIAKKPNEQASQSQAIILEQIRDEAIKIYRTVAERRFL